MQLMFKTTPAFTEVDPNKVFYNVGALIDHLTGKYVKGQRGENIMNGGLSVFTAVMGKPNTYKTKLARYMMLSAASKVAYSGILPYMNTYDTEINIDVGHCISLSQKFPSFVGHDLVKLGAWKITDKSHHLGNEWFSLLRGFLKGEKIKNKKDYMMETPYVDKDGKPIFTIFPSFNDMDSVSEFQTSATEEIQNKNEIGDSGGNTIHMRSGLDKTRLLMEIPGLCHASSHYMIMTAHVGKEIMMAGSMAMPTKALPHMKPGEQVKGVAGKFLYLTNLLWQTTHSVTFNNQTTKGPEYPKTRDQVDEGSMDLNLVTVKLVRNKFGPSGYSIDLLISQTEGVLPSLSEFHYIKEHGRFGLEGNDRNYNLALYPGVSLQRTTVRGLIDSDPLLRRAIKITADLLQIKTYHKDITLEIPDLKDLYAKLDKEYGWKTILETRDFWTFKNYEHPVPFLSTLDILEMYHDKYVPYWFKKK